MRKTVIIFSVLMLMAGCFRPTPANIIDNHTEIEEVSDSIEEWEETFVGLNEIRFRNWTQEDWNDNDYFRFLRKCFDDCYNGIDNFETDLQEFKPFLNQKFYIYTGEPFVGGGMYILLGFLEKPAILYETVVYGCVEDNVVTDYKLHGFRKYRDTIDFTKERIFEIMEKEPMLKLW